MSTPAIDPALSALHSAVFSDGHTAVSYSTTGKVMGTRARITCIGGVAGLPEKLFAFLTILEGRWSRFLEDSEVTLMNCNPGVPLQASHETRQLVMTMKSGFAATGGAFDPTLLPALMSEGYRSSIVNPNLVSHVHEGAKLRGNIDEVEVGDTTVTVPLGTTIDSGGVGKGLAADLLAQMARAEGALGVIVEIGGDLRVSGFSPRGDSWRLAIEDPWDPKRQASVIEICESGVATSTVLKRRFEVGSRETHHIINPRTLKSTESDTVQATVIAKTASEAEMWTKVAFVDGHDALFTAAKKKGFHAGCFLSSGEWLTTSEWPVAHA